VRARADRRVRFTALAIVLTAVCGAVLQTWLPGITAPQAAGPAVAAAPRDTERTRLAKRHFDMAVALLQQGLYADAAAALQQVLAVYPALPEAHLNMGYALLGAGDSRDAAAWFDRASDLRPTLRNAYYGLALAERQNANHAAALAAMQTFAHLADADDRYLPHALEFIHELQSERQEASP